MKPSLFNLNTNYPPDLYVDIDKMCLPGIVSSFSDSASLCGDKRRKVLAKYSGYLVQLTGVSIKK